MKDFRNGNCLDRFSMNRRHWKINIVNNVPGRWDRENMKEVQSVLWNSAVVRTDLHIKPSLVQVLARHPTQGLAGSFGTFHNTLRPSEPTLQLA